MHAFMATNVDFDKKFMSVYAKISGETIFIPWARKTKLMAVRYSWTDDAGKSNLFNKKDFQQFLS